MHPELQRSFDGLERQKTAVLARLSSWPAERIQFQPSPNAWSAGEVADHLLKVEAAWLEDVHSHLPGGHPVAMKDRLGAALVNGVMRSPLRVKVPRGIDSVLPQARQNFPKVVQWWNRLRPDMKALLQTLSEAQVRCGLFRHPVGGWMAMPTALAFLSAHLQHHTYQIRRLERASHDL